MDKTKLNIIDLGNLREVCRGDISKELRYLRQFELLIPNRIDLLRNALKHNNFSAVRQEVHKLSPQAEFFGIDQVVNLKRRLELEEGEGVSDQLEALISDIISILQEATEEIGILLKNGFSKESG